jgi:glucose-1-phosphate thymidylyltransferase
VEVAKALILAGRNIHDRPWPSVRYGSKHLVPVANRPILFHHLETLRRAGMVDATIALDAESEEPIMAAVRDGSDWDLRVRYVRWRPVTGVSGALVAARDIVAGGPVLVEPADALHRHHMEPHIVAFAHERLDTLALRLSGVPSTPGGEWVAAGYLLSRLAVSMLLAQPGTVTDPLTGVRDQGGHVRVQEVDGCLPCHGGQDKLLEGNRRMLEAMQGETDVAAFASCELQGRVVVHPSARMEHTLIRGPAIIGPGTRLSHAYVGPYTSVGADVEIDGSQIEHSIVLDGAQLRHVGTRIETSVIGRGSRVTRSFALPSAMRLSLGDSAEVTLS